MTLRQYKVLVAIKQPLIEAGIVTFLSDRPNFSVIDVLHNAENIASSIANKRPNLLIIDYHIPGFLTLDDLKTIVQHSRDLNVLVISTDDDKTTILKAVQLGIKGYITKECSKSEFLLAVESTARGEKFFCSRILDIIISNNFPEEKPEETTTLTTREQEILKMLAQGHSTQKIASTLHLSPHTVQTHRKSIIRKLKIKSPTQFVISALDMGLITQK